jgi:hypothetical protein
MPDVIPFSTYEDGIAALEWLATALRVRARGRAKEERMRAVAKERFSSEITLTSPCSKR